MLLKRSVSEWFVTLTESYPENYGQKGNGNCCSKPNVQGWNMAITNRQMSIKVTIYDFSAILYLLYLFPVN